MAVVRIKICGITRSQDARVAVSAGAWAVGFVFYPQSPRFINLNKARAIIKSLPPFIEPVGVFVNETEEKVKRIASFCSLRTLQFHGDESPSYCRFFKTKFKVIKAFRVADQCDIKTIQRYDVSAVLMDTYQPGRYGGTGIPFSWSLMKNLGHLEMPLIISGGLTSDNVKQALTKFEPFAVDVSSGVESSPGIKDRRKIENFINAVYVT